MDTRFWGPSGWKLLHLMSWDYHYTSENAITYSNFLEAIPYILPCKFCRSSLTDYYRQHPYQILNGNTWMNPMLEMKKWMYTIHCCVNKKLRKQGLHPEPDPTYAQVKKVYEVLHKESWDKQLALMWDFLFAVGYHHPKESAFDSPLPDCPKEVQKCTDPCEQNKWNLLPWKKRMPWFQQFWTYLPGILPGGISPHWKRVEAANPPTLRCRRSTLAWLWRMRCGLDSHFHDPYTSICKKIAMYSSDCGRTRDAITCRKRSTKRKTLKKTKDGRK
jgi:Erv1 / Alr family